MLKILASTVKSFFIALFAARFREAAGRALLLPRRKPGERTPLWLQRRKSADLLGVAGALFFLISGRARVEKGGQTIATLSRGSFAAGLSFLSREPASADVLAEGAVEFNSWNQKKLRRLNKIDPELYVKIQGILGRDISNKMRAASSRIQESA